MARFGNSFLNEKQELAWKAFKGECGKAFEGHPFFMEDFMEYEFERSFLKDDGREL